MCYFLWVIKALFGPKKIRSKESWKEKKWKGKEKLKESDFLSLVRIREKTQGKKMTFQQTFFPLFGTRKINQEKKIQDRQDQTKQFTSHFLQSLFENYLPAK